MLRVELWGTAASCGFGRKDKNACTDTPLTEEGSSTTLFWSEIQLFELCEQMLLYNQIDIIAQVVSSLYRLVCRE